MAHRDAAHENEITPIDVHSVEWSDRSVPVQKHSGVVVIITIAIRCTSDTARAGQHGSTHPIDKVFQCGGSVTTQSIDMAFPVRWFVLLSLDQQS